MNRFQMICRCCFAHALLLTRLAEHVRVHSNNTECFTDLGLEPIYTTGPAAFKNDAQFKSDQNWLENKQIVSLI